MQRLQVVDERILALFTKFSHWFQRLTGLTNYFLARACVFLVLTSISLDVVNYWSRILYSKPSALVFPCYFLIVLWGLSRTYLSHEADKLLESDSSVKPLIKLLEKESSWNLICRLLFLCASLLFLVDVVVDFIKGHPGSLFLNIHSKLFYAYMSSFMYFVIVDPLGPGKSKVRQWKEEFQAGRQKLQPIHKPTKG